MKACLSTVYTSVLMNRSPIDPIHMQRGVRQGDPISPFLFTISAEGLFRLLEKARNMGFISGIFLNEDLNDISILQFADDTIIFLPYDLDMVESLIQMNMIYHHIHRFQLE